MLYFYIGIVIVFFDQFVKTLIKRHFAIGESISLIPGFFSLTYVRNPGAAWGILGNYTYALSILSITVLVFLLLEFNKIFGEKKINKISGAILIAGILGNLIDRLKYLYVVDFLDFHIKAHHFPAFNVADSSICIGVAIFVFGQFIERKEKKSV